MQIASVRRCRCASPTQMPSQKTSQQKGSTAQTAASHSPFSQPGVPCDSTQSPQDCSSQELHPVLHGTRRAPVLEVPSAEVLHFDDLLARAARRVLDGEEQPLRVGRGGFEDTADRPSARSGWPAACQMVGTDSGMTVPSQSRTPRDAVAVVGGTLVRHAVVQNRQVEVTGAAAETVHQHVVGLTRRWWASRTSS